jgi:hypothetical protein
MRIAEGQKIPRFYGIAHWEIETYSGVAYPMPLHWLVCLGRRIYYWAQQGTWEKELKRAWDMGYWRGDSHRRTEEMIELRKAIWQMRAEDVGRLLKNHRRQ